MPFLQKALKSQELIPSILQHFEPSEDCFVLGTYGSTTALRVYLNEGCNPSGNGEGPQERGKEDNILWRREVNVLNCCEKELSHEVEGIHLAIMRKYSQDLGVYGIAHQYLSSDSAMLPVAKKLLRSQVCTACLLFSYVTQNILESATRLKLKDVDASARLVNLHPASVVLHQKGP